MTFLLLDYYLSTTIDVEKAAIEASTSFTTTEPAVAEELATSMDTKGEKVQELGMTKQNGNEDPTPDFQTRTTSSSRTKPHVVLNGKRISASRRTESVTPQPVAKAVPSGRRKNASEPNHVYHYIDDELNNVCLAIRSLDYQLISQGTLSGQIRCVRLERDERGHLGLSCLLA